MGWGVGPPLRKAVGVGLMDRWVAGSSWPSGYNTNTWHCTRAIAMGPIKKGGAKAGQVALDGGVQGH